MGSELTNQLAEPVPRGEAEEPRPEPEEPEPEPTKPVVVVSEKLPEKVVLKHVDNKYVSPEAKSDKPPTLKWEDIPVFGGVHEEGHCAIMASNPIRIVAIVSMLFTIVRVVWCNSSEKWRADT